MRRQKSRPKPKVYPQYLELDIDEEADGVRVVLQDYTTNHDGLVALALAEALGVKVKVTCNSPCG